MGQKVSTLGDVFSWKNSDSSKSNDTSGRSSPRSRESVTGDACTLNNTFTNNDQPHYENICLANNSPLDLIGLDDAHPKCCGPLMADVETTSKNTQTSKSSSSKKLNWAQRFNYTRPKSKNSKCCNPSESVTESNDVKCDTCVCTGYRRTEDANLDASIVNDATPAVEVDEQNEEEPQESSQQIVDFDGAYNAFDAFNAFENHSPLVLPSFENHTPLVLPSFDDDLMDLGIDYVGEEYMNEDLEDKAYKERAKEIQEGIEPPPGFRPGLHMHLLEFNLPQSTIDNLTSIFQQAGISPYDPPEGMEDSHRIHTSIDYIHYLVPDLQQITNCTFYWGKMDRYEAEKLLENKPEGTFLLRDSAQEEYLFSVSFRKYGRSLHARIEQWNHLFSFDSRDPGVFASSTVCGLIEHYKDPSCCMFFEPMLTIPLNRNFTFSLQHTCRAAICNNITYDDVNQLKLPKVLKSYLKEYHYKQRVRVRIFDPEN